MPCYPGITGWKQMDDKLDGVALLVTGDGFKMSLGVAKRRMSHRVSCVPGK